MSHDLTSPSGRSKQGVALGHSTATVSADYRDFPPSVFSPGVHEDKIELFTSSSDNNNESYDIEYEKTPNPVDHPTFRACDDNSAVRCNEGKRPPEVIDCPFYDRDFRHFFYYTRETLEPEGSWKAHILNVHWPKGGRRRPIVVLYGSTLLSTSGNFISDVLAEGCFVYSSRGDHVPQHMDEIHRKKKR